MWWHEAVVYQIYPRSFADGDGDGVGDLAGLREPPRPPGLARRRRPLAVADLPVADGRLRLRRRDHCDVDPVFGTLADADALVADAHDRGLRVLLDWVPEPHLDRAPVVARERPDFYVWRDGGRTAGRPTTGSGRSRSRRRCRPGPATRRAGRWYLHLFLPEQPDLDWSNPELVEAHARRAAVLARPGRRRLPGRRHPLHRQGPGAARRPARARRHPPLVDPRGPPHPRPAARASGPCSTTTTTRVMVGEVYLVGERITERTATYVGPDQLHLAFDFSPAVRPRGATPPVAPADRPHRRRLRAPRTAGGRRGCCRTTTTPATAPATAPRRRPGRRRCCCSGVRGTPFLYAGEELGLEDADVPPDRVVDPGGRDGCRAPLPWTPAAGHGWGAGAVAAVPARRRPSGRSRPSGTTPASILWLYKRLLAARQGVAGAAPGRPAAARRRRRRAWPGSGRRRRRRPAGRRRRLGGDGGAGAGRAGAAGRSRSPPTAPPARASPSAASLAAGRAVLARVRARTGET